MNKLLKKIDWIKFTPYISFLIVVIFFYSGYKWINSKQESTIQLFDNSCEFFSKFKEYQRSKFRPQNIYDDELKRIQTFQTAEEEAKAFTPKVEVLHVRRVAGAYMIMTSPASYNKKTTSSFNVIITKEKGTGAEFDDITVFHLSDGTVIKATTKENFHWLGASVGTTVHKLTYKQVSLQGNTYTAQEVTKYIPLL